MAKEVYKQATRMKLQIKKTRLTSYEKDICYVLYTAVEVVLILSILFLFFLQFGSTTLKILR